MATPIETFKQFKDYFANLVGKYGLKFFVFGDSSRIMNAQSSIAEYPVLWLHTPDIKPFHSGGRQNRFTSDFLVLKDSSIDDWDQQEQNFDDCLEIVWAILRGMERDSDSGVFDFDIDHIDIQPKMYSTADNLKGWFVTFSISTPGCDNDCCED